MSDQKPYEFQYTETEGLFNLLKEVEQELLQSRNLGKDLPAAFKRLNEALQKADEKLDPPVTSTALISIFEVVANAPDAALRDRLERAKREAEDLNGAEVNDKFITHLSSVLP